MPTGNASELESPMLPSGRSPTINAGTQPFPVNQMPSAFHYVYARRFG